MPKSLLVALLCLFTVSTSQAFEEANSEFQISIAPSLAIHERHTEIEGLSLNLIWGENPQTNCLAIGLINGSTGKSNGVSFGLVNYTETYSGLQLGIYNTSSQKVYGAQLGLINQARSFNGLQLGILNRCDHIGQGV